MEASCVEERLDARELWYVQLDHFLDFVTSPWRGNCPLQGGYLLADRSVLGTANDIHHDLLYCIRLRVVSIAADNNNASNARGVGSRWQNVGQEIKAVPQEVPISNSMKYL